MGFNINNFFNKSFPGLKNLQTTQDLNPLKRNPLVQKLLYGQSRPRVGTSETKQVTVEQNPYSTKTSEDGGPKLNTNQRSERGPKKTKTSKTYNVSGGSNTEMTETEKNVGKGLGTIKRRIKDKTSGGVNTQGGFNQGEISVGPEGTTKSVKGSKVSGKMTKKHTDEITYTTPGGNITVGFNTKSEVGGKGKLETNFNRDGVKLEGNVHVGQKSGGSVFVEGGGVKLGLEGSLQSGLGGSFNFSIGKQKDGTYGIKQGMSLSPYRGVGYNISLQVDPNKAKQSMMKSIEFVGNSIDKAYTSGQFIN